MKAAWFEEFGDAQNAIIFGEQPKPEPNTGEVLIKLQFTGVNPSDVKKRAGSLPDLLDGGFVIPHSDGAGVIEAVGHGVPSERVGERVWVYQAQYARRFGTAAEYVAIESSRAPTLPDNTSFEIGACLGIPVMTAHRCVFADGPLKAKTVLVTGGAGRVGFYAIQWAKAAGAWVIATASNLTDVQTCIELGADDVVNHRSADWGERVLDLLQGEKVDRVVDVEFGENLNEVSKFIRIGGTIATYSSMRDAEPKLPFFKMMYMDFTVRVTIVYAMPETAKEHAVADINRFLEEGKLKHRVAKSLSFTDIKKAHELIENANLRGSVVVNIN